MKIIYILLIALLVISCPPKAKPEKAFATLNKIVYDHFSQDADSTSFKGDAPWLLNYDNQTLLLFNHEVAENFQPFRNFPETNHPPQFQELTVEYLPDFSEDLFQLGTKNMLYLKLDKELFHLESLNNAAKLELLIYITQKLYIAHLKKYNRELTDFPSIYYPITNIENQIYSSIEYKILLQALENAQKNEPEMVIYLLKTFYAFRINRWRSQSSFVQTYELSQEKVLGLSYYKTFQMLQSLENKETQKNIHYHFLNKITTDKIIKEKLLAPLDDQLIALNSMSKQKSENIGFILALLYDYLGWNYLPESTKENFHIFLGTKLSITSSEIDELYREYLKDIDINYLTELAEQKKTIYENRFEDQKTNYNLQIFFDHYTEDFYNSNETYFVNFSEKNILFPNANKYKIKSNWIDIEITKLGFLYNLDRKNKNIKTTLPNNTLIWINDNELFSIENLINQDFETLHFTSNNLKFKTNAPGKANYSDGILYINVTPKLRYFIEEEYWEDIEELNRRLIERGVPENWLETHINNDKFRIYSSVVRNFTVMPEAQVARGERDQDWYKRHFGVDAKVKKGQEFRKTHQQTLLAAEKRHGIHYELAIAILAIESDFGNPRFRGNYYTFSTLVSQYLLLPRRQRFAVNELVALYKFSQNTNNDVYYFIGSFAGAAGLGQFIPTSMNTYFIDANDIPTNIDIYSLDDNIHSILNYLHKNGLSNRNINNYNARFKAVRAYNHSDAYARAVLYIYDELRKTR